MEPESRVARPFSEGMARVKIGEKYGFINTSGKIVIPAQFEDADDFSDGMARVQKSGKWGYVDKSGQLEIPLEYDLATSFGDGLALVKDGKKRGWIDKNAQFVIPAKFDQLRGRANEAPAKRWGLPAVLPAAGSVAN
ncbi:MAG TPA: WG repeat-containing protein [Candidatus Polarisedimenticolia bacterium]|nr:WG repeat-containing protein [Candidatus Polarisedimenticolia bacterium]